MDRHGGNIFDKRIEHDFSVSLSPLGMPDGVKAAIKYNLDKLEGYPDVNQLALRQAIGTHYSITTDLIACGNGAADLIFRIPKAIKNFTERRKALIVGPAFSEYERGLIEAGFETLYTFCYKCDYEYNPESKGNKIEECSQNPSSIVMETLLEEIEGGEYGIVFAANPSNPMGLLLDGEEVRAIAETCEASQTFLIMDECFLELTREEKEATLLGTIDRLPHSIVLRSFTKTYAMAGLRLGYAIFGDRDVASSVLEQGQPWSLSGIAEAAGIAALNETEYVRRSIDLISVERDYVAGALKNLGLNPSKSKANYLFFSGPVGLDEALIERGILIRNCSNYKGLKTAGEGANSLEPKSENAICFYRTAIRTRTENDVLLNALADELPKTWKGKLTEEWLGLRKMSREKDEPEER